MFLQDDMWAVGAILAELFMLSPLFPGESEIDQIYRICTILGTPDNSVWPEGMVLERSVYFNFFQFQPANLSDIIPNASLEAIDLILQLCSWDPQRRPTAEQSLQHPFFHVGTWVPCPLQDSSQLKKKQTGDKPKLELNLWDFGTESDDCFLGLTLAVKPSIPDREVGNHVLQQPSEDFLFYTRYQDHSSQSVFWPLLSSDHNINDVRNISSLPSPYMLSSQASLMTVGVPESSAFAFPAVQPNLLDNSAFGPMMSLSSPIQHGRLFE